MSSAFYALQMGFTALALLAVHHLWQDRNQNGEGAHHKGKKNYARMCWCKSGRFKGSQGPIEAETKEEQLPTRGGEGHDEDEDEASSSGQKMFEEARTSRCYEDSVRITGGLVWNYAYLDAQAETFVEGYEGLQIVAAFEAPGTSGQSRFYVISTTFLPLCTHAYLELYKGNGTTGMLVNAELSVLDASVINAPTITCWYGKLQARREHSSGLKSKRFEDGSITLKDRHIRTSTRRGSSRGVSQWSDTHDSHTTSSSAVREAIFKAVQESPIHYPKKICNARNSVALADDFRSCLLTYLSRIKDNIVAEAPKPEPRASSSNGGSTVIQDEIAVSDKLQQ
ncbi:uncharacterized protein EV420DRAFT_1480846 [Desarmillaria tabescens]|uniref:MATH domain-containing protein n=1 Tax=Armillaria tabescens TaxID=1929756 RepID=A0AA39KAP6_ARMTA|nr:uncharacterized protein EV420DRAFT_1480846 [Desarmillaria tabescens]KAK0457373.1 hypothetical protein EV420DRAFT_1480846 [Desarmillaria tabescens]